MGVKKKVGDMGKYRTTKQDLEAYVWCIRNGIHISPLAKFSNAWYVDIEMNGKSSRDPNVYGPVEIWEKVFKYYKYYFNKNK